MKLGKLKARRDRRNLKLARFLKPLPELPPAFDVDMSLPVLPPLFMFANDEWGDCVIAERAHHTLRLEAVEQGRLIPISDQEVLAAYWREGGGDALTRPDNGLVMLDSLKAWRSPGWAVGGQHYDIYAFAEVQRQRQYEIQAAIYLLNGLAAGFALPKSAEQQFNRGQCWYVIKGRTSASGSWGGHAMHLCGYSHIGLTAITWGKKQLMSWEFFHRYCDEAYAVVDNKNRFMVDSPLDIAKLSEYLRRVTEGT
jgi:hypothetical protein